MYINNIKSNQGDFIVNNQGQNYQTALKHTQFFYCFSVIPEIHVCSSPIQAKFVRRLNDDTITFILKKASLIHWKNLYVESYELIHKVPRFL